MAKNVQFMTSNRTGGGSLKCSFLSQLLQSQDVNKHKLFIPGFIAAISKIP